jgi:hypothetical protein
MPMEETANPSFLAFLQKKVSSTRDGFYDAARKLEEFEQVNGSLVYAVGMEECDRSLSEKAHLAYLAYRKAWVEWYAAVNGFRLDFPAGSKETPVFAAAVPARELLETIKKSSQQKTAQKKPAPSPDLFFADR